MNEINITVSIAGRDYKLTVERKDEEIVREAQKTVNQSIKKYAELYSHNDFQDLLAMVVIQSTVSVIKLEKEHEYRNDTLLTRLELIDSLLSEVKV